MNEELSSVANQIGQGLCHAVESVAESISAWTDSENNLTLAEELGLGLRRIAEAITPVAAPGTDAAGGSVQSLTEAVMGITAGLVQVAQSLQEVADAIRNRD